MSTTQQELEVRLPREFRQGAAAMLSIIAGYAAFACTVGVAVAHSTSPAAAWSGVWLIFAGTAHLTAIQLVNSGCSVPIAAFSVILVNLRLGLFSASLAPHWRGTRLRSRFAAAATLVDPTWLLAARRFSADGNRTSAAGRRYYFGASTVLWIGWPVLVTVGMLVGNILPTATGLQLMPTLLLLALVFPGIRNKRSAACALAAAAVALAGSSLPSGLPLLLAIPAGVAAAVMTGHAGRARSRS